MSPQRGNRTGGHHQSMTLQDHIRRYLEFVAWTDRLFLSVAEAHGDLVSCSRGCDDCCSVYFHLSLIEAFYLSGMARNSLTPQERTRVVARAKEARPLFKQAEDLLGNMRGSAVPEQSGLQETASRLRIPCPMKEGAECVLYSHRPITCRIYGAPQRIGDRVVSCPKSGFAPGGTYVTIDVDAIQRRLFHYSRDLLRDLIGAAPSQPPGPLFTMADAVTTVFDKDFFLTLEKTLQ